MIKKILFFISLLLLPPLATATCSGQVNWTMHINNQTNHTIKLDCGDDISPGTTSTVSGVSGNAQQCKVTSGTQCNYTDAMNGHQGTLSLIFTSCANISSSVSTNKSYPLPYACPLPISPKLIDNNLTLCENGNNQKIPTYAAESYFTIAQGTSDYTIVWTNLTISNIVEGQAMAYKLANLLKNTGNYNYINASASYDNNKTVKIILSKSNAQNPYSVDATSCE